MLFRSGGEGEVEERVRIRLMGGGRFTSTFCDVRGGGGGGGVSTVEWLTTDTLDSDRAVSSLQDGGRAVIQVEHCWVVDLHGYLEVAGQDGFPAVFDLPELGPQPLHLVLHLHDVLEVPLGAEVQDLNGLGHVLDL